MCVNLLNWDVSSIVLVWFSITEITKYCARQRPVRERLREHWFPSLVAFRDSCGKLCASRFFVFLFSCACTRIFVPPLFCTLYFTVWQVWIYDSFKLWKNTYNRNSIILTFVMYKPSLLCSSRTFSLLQEKTLCSLISASPLCNTCHTYTHTYIFWICHMDRIICRGFFPLTVYSQFIYIVVCIADFFL